MGMREIWLVRHGESVANVAASRAELDGAAAIDIAQRDADVLEAFLAGLPRDTAAALELAAGHDARVAGRAHLVIDGVRPIRHAFEPRHESFGDAAALDILRRYDVALVEADTAGTWPRFREPTASFRYVRLHGSQALYAGGYSDAELDEWAAAIRSWRAAGDDVYVYFDNDIDGRAPFDAEGLRARLRT